jgi:cathepsin L
MRTVVALCVLFAFATAFTEKEYEQTFTKWMIEFDKTYEPAEFFYRFEVFKSTMDFVEEFNARNGTSTVGLTQFADLTSAEFKLIYLGYKPELARTKRVSLADLEQPQYPGSLDWVAKGAVTPIKNQGQCGSCWAFSTTGSVEGVVEIKHSSLVSLSEQQLVDCAGKYGNMGCNGGLMDNAFKYVEANGLATEASYPYTGRDGTCKSFTASPYTKITSYKDVTPHDANALGTSVDMNPVSVAIEADQAVFQHYTGGVISSGCGQTLDHGVLVVGYGTDTKAGDYWKVKNSWGVTWGEQGYVRISRSGDVCGILNEPSYPVD